MVYIRKNLIQIMLFVSNIFLFITVIGLFLYMRNVESRVNSVFSTFGSQFNSLDSIVEEYQGMKAIDFNLQVIGSDNLFTLDDISGQPALLVFTWTDCIYCKEMYPELARFSQKYLDINTVMISRGTPEANQELFLNQEFSFPILQADDSVYEDYNVPGTPFFYYLNEDGYIQTLFFANSLEDIENYVFDLSS